MRFIFIFFLLNNCSLNNDSKYWTEESINLNEENINLCRDKTKLH